MVEEVIDIQSGIEDEKRKTIEAYLKHLEDIEGRIERLRYARMRCNVSEVDMDDKLDLDRYIAVRDILLNKIVELGYIPKFKYPSWGIEPLF